jgi:hypothetical protein
MKPMIDPRISDRCPARCTGPPAGPRIFVFGCARSGTTLLLNLLRTFDGVSVLDGEHCVRELVADPSAGWVAAKRRAHCADHLPADLPDLRPVWIIDILRDPRDVVTSRLATFPGFYCDYPRWERDVRLAAALRGQHLRMLHLRYEHLVTAGDQVQQDLGEVLGLEACVPFSSHLSVMPTQVSRITRITLGGVRPLSSERVGRWRCDPAALDRVAEQLRMHPGMESSLQAAAYAPTETEAMWTLTQTAPPAAESTYRPGPVATPHPDIAKQAVHKTSP